MSSRVRDLWHVTRDGERVRSPRYGKGRRWLAVWRDEAGQERTRACDTKAQAERLARTSATDVERGTYLDPDAGRVLLRDYAATWLERQMVKPSTREAYQYALATRLGPLAGMQVRHITPGAVQAQVAALSATLAPSTVRQMLRVLSAVLGAAQADGLIRANPATSASVKPPKGRREPVAVWTLDQVLEVSWALPERHEALPVLLAGAGLRQGEAFGLAVEDIDFLRRVIHLRRQVAIVGARQVFSDPKHGSARTVPLASHVGEALAAHLARFRARSVTLPTDEPGGEPQSHDLVLTSREGGALNRNYLNGVWKDALVLAAIPPTRANGMHALRHTFASTLLASGVGVPAVAGWLGHRDPAFTLRVYGHLVPDAEDRSREALESAWGDAHGTGAEQAASAGG